MLVTGKSILDRGLLEGGSEDNILSGGYYLRIHRIIPYDTSQSTRSTFNPVIRHVLSPGAAAWIVSEEIFNIRDSGITALVTLRSSFTKKGLLAMDVGLVDANYRGPIGTVVVNISKNNIMLRRGEGFFRVLFLQHEKIESKFQYNVREYDHKSYIDERREEIARDFPGTFLQVDEVEKRISDQFASGHVARELEQSIADRVLLAIIKRYWWKAIFAVVIMIGISVFSVFLLFGDLLNKEYLKEYLRTTITEEAAGNIPSK